MSTLGIVQVEHETWAKQGSAFRRLAGKPLIEWVVRRVTESLRLDRVVVALGPDANDRRLATLVPVNVPVCFGETTDGLHRLCRVVEAYPADAVVRVSANNPFIDPALIDRLINAGQQEPACDYAAFSLSDGAPAVHSPLGVPAEWFTRGALRKADKLATGPEERGDMTHCVLANFALFRVRLVPLPQALDRSDVRLTVDSFEDWENAVQIYEALGPDRLDWQGITGLLDEHPGIRERMAQLNLLSRGQQPALP